MRTIEDVLFGFKDRAPRGFALALHIHYITPSFLVQTYAPAWVSLYNREGLLMKDPVVRWGLRNTGTCRWSDLDHTDGVLEAAARHGSVYGAACAIDQDGSRSMLGASRDDREYTDEEIHSLARELRDIHILTNDEGAFLQSARGELERVARQLAA